MRIVSVPNFNKQRSHLIVTAGEIQFQLALREQILIRALIQKFPGARTLNDSALCYQVQSYRYFVHQSRDLGRHKFLYCSSTSVCYSSVYFVVTQSGNISENRTRNSAKENMLEFIQVRQNTKTGSTSFYEKRFTSYIYLLKHNSNLFRGLPAGRN